MFRERLEKEKIGHQAPVGWRDNNFNSIEIESGYAFCYPHNFAFDKRKELMKLYYGLPCFHTDVRFNTYDPIRGSFMHWTRFKDISLKACIRKVMRCKGLPVGTIVKFNKSWFHTNNIDNSFKFVVRKENPNNIQYELNDPELSANFSSCKFSQDLTKALRENGFLVFVEPNKSFLTSMINTAVSANGGELTPNRIEGEVATAYGHGKKIGFSSYENDLMGYTSGEKHILWDKFGYFDKWSKCEQISKNKSIEEIIKILKEDNGRDDE